MIGKAEDFLNRLKDYDKDNIPDASLRAVKVYIDKPDFTPEKVNNVSSAASGLCSWVVNIVRYYEVYCDVKPKRDALAEANEQLRRAQKRLSDVMEKVSRLEAEQQKLQEKFEFATQEKLNCQRAVEHTNKTIELANRLSPAPSLPCITTHHSCVTSSCFQIGGRSSLGE